MEEGSEVHRGEAAGDMPPGAELVERGKSGCASLMTDLLELNKALIAANGHLRSTIGRVGCPVMPPCSEAMRPTEETVRKLVRRAQMVTSDIVKRARALDETL